MNRLKLFEIFNYASIGFIALALALMLFKVIPTEWYVPILIFSLILLLIRVAFRFYFIFQNKKNKE